MKIVVIGGSGLIGSKLVIKLREHGHEAIAASPSSGVDTLTGEGLAEALKGCAAGDVLVVWKLDRLARSLHDLVVIAEDLKARGAGLKF